jgi:hypothetical protein
MAILAMQEHRSGDSRGRAGAAALQAGQEGSKLQQLQHRLRLEDGALAKSRGQQGMRAGEAHGAATALESLAQQVGGQTPLRAPFASDTAAAAADAVTRV